MACSQEYLLKWVNLEHLWTERVDQNPGGVGACGTSSSQYNEPCAFPYPPMVAQRGLLVTAVGCPGALPDPTNQNV